MPRAGPFDAGGRLCIHGRIVMGSSLRAESGRVVSLLGCEAHPESWTRAARAALAWRREARLRPPFPMLRCPSQVGGFSAHMHRHLSAIGKNRSNLLEDRIRPQI